VQAGRQTGTGGYTYSRRVDKPAGRQADRKAVGRRTGVIGAGREADRNMHVHIQQKGRQFRKHTGRYVEELGRRTGVTGAGREADRYKRVHAQQRGRQTGRQTGKYVEGVRQTDRRNRFKQGGRQLQADISIHQKGRQSGRQTGRYVEEIRQTERRYTCRQGGRQVQAGTHAAREKTDLQADRQLDTVHR
jgi:hypothetical protein